MPGRDRCQSPRLLSKAVQQSYLHNADGSADHIHGGSAFTGLGVYALDALFFQDLIDAAEHDVQFFQRSAAQTVYQNSNFIAGCVGQVGQNAFHHVVNDLISRLQLGNFYAGFAMDTHAQFHLAGFYGEVGLAVFGDNTGGQSYAKGANVVGSLLGYTGNFFQRQHAVGSTACALEYEVDACYAAALVFFTLGGGSNVVSAQNMHNLDVVKSTSSSAISKFMMSPV